jgi:hypothetical protein
MLFEREFGIGVEEPADLQQFGAEPINLLDQRLLQGIQHPSLSAIEPRLQVTENLPRNARENNAGHGLEATSLFGAHRTVVQD